MTNIQVWASSQHRCAALYVLAQRDRTDNERGARKGFGVRHNRVGAGCTLGPRENLQPPSLQPALELLNQEVLVCHLADAAPGNGRKDGQG